MSLVLFGLSHVTGEESDRMHKGLFESEVLLRDFYVLDKHVQVACQVVADFDLPLLSNAADCFDQILVGSCLLYTSPSPRDATLSRMPSSA